MTVPDAPAEAPKPSPGAPFVPAPRLGIIHLLVWTACVAVYLGTQKTAFEPPRSEHPVEAARLGRTAILQTALALGAGTAVTGPVLVVVLRRKRSLAPVHPGETLWVVQGVVAILGLATLAPVRLFFSPDAALVIILAVLGVSAGSAVVFLTASMHTPQTRWRAYFFLLALLAPSHFCFLLPPIALLRSSYGTGLLSAPVLLAIVLKDAWDGVKYPWTHWTGVGVAFWGALVYATYYAFEFASW